MRLKTVLDDFKNYLYKVAQIFIKSNKEFLLDKDVRLKMISSSIAFYLIWTIVPLSYLVIEIIVVVAPSILDSLSELVFEAFGQSGLDSFHFFIDNRVFEKPSVFIFFIVSLLISISKLTRTILLSNELIYGKKNILFKIKISIIVRTILSTFITAIIPIVLSIVLIGYNVLLSLIYRLADVLFFDTVLIWIIGFLVVPVTIYLVVLVVYSLSNPVSKKFSDNYIASVFVSVSWILVSTILGNFILANLNLNIYGSFTIIVLLIIWAYVFSYIFTIGLIMNKYILLIKEQGNIIQKIKSIK